MNFAERLARLTAQTRPVTQIPTVGQILTSGEPIRKKEMLINAHVIDNAGGNGGFLRRESRFALGLLHGARQLSDTASLDYSKIAELCGLCEPPATGLHVFFDTETTSLASGAGVYVFLIGFAWVDRGDFIIEQLFLENPGGEPQMLAAAAERIRSASLLLSFAGRAFDEHRLEDRYRFLRLASPFVRERHADLCPPARALWSSRLPSCSLGVLERERLGFARVDDLPGEACPDAYFRSLRGDRGAAEAVLRHNLLDLLSTAVLAAELAHRATRTTDPAELLGLGRLWRRKGRARAALEAFAGAEAEERRTPRLRPDERRLLALEHAALLKRAGDPGGAAERWQAQATGPEPALEALIELAKDAEHRLRDLVLAARCTAEALSLLRRRFVDASVARRAMVEADLTRRLARVEAKLARAERTILLA